MAVDTPDFQQGVVAAQQLLATEASGSTTVTVTLPANTQTLVIVCEGGSGAPTVTVTGHATSIPYPGSQLAQGTNTGANVAFMFDVAPAVDSEVTVDVTGGGSPNWWVYCDDAPHVVVNLGP